MRRPDHVQRLRDEAFDVLVVGGGITGAGVAFEAATRGLSTALVEKDDFASGTSSKSSKLIHGGLRYLAHLDIGVVREGLRERGILQQMAPFLVEPVPFVIPRYGKRRLLALRAGLEAYDLLAWGSGFPRHRRLETDDVLRLAPALRPEVGGGFVYWDARTDDARLTWTVVRSAVEHGAVVANHAEVISLVRSGPAIRNHPRAGGVCGAVVRDDETGEAFEVRARVVVNATGVWSDELRRMENPDEAVGIRPSKGIHLIFERDRIPVNAALSVPAPDGRYIFVIPWQDGRVLVGTTDEDYTGSLDEPRAHGPEVDYLIRTLNRVVVHPVSREDVVASFAGLRPLIQKPGQRSKDLSRRHKVLTGDGGVVTITGGKLTAWRPMAVETVDAVLQAGAFKQRPPTRSPDIPLAGGDEPPGLEEALAAHAHRVGLDPRHAARLYRRYGTRTTEVLQLVEADATLAEPLHPDLPYLRAELTHAIAAEMAMRPADVLGRRLRARATTRDRGAACLEAVADALADAHGWSTERRVREIASYRREVEADLAAEADAGSTH